VVARLKKVLHLLDDPALGGVSRLLDSLIEALGDGFVHERKIVNTRLSSPPKYDANVVIVHFTVSWIKLPYLTALRLRHPNARIILVEHSYTGAMEAALVTHKRRFRAMLRLAYRTFDEIVAVSQGQARWIVEAELAEARRVTVIPCVLDLAPFANIALPEPHIGPTRLGPMRLGPMRLGAIGRYHPQKGFDTLIEAMRRISPETVHLSMAGYGQDEAALRMAAAGLPHVHIQGSVDPVAFIGACDAVVMPSRWEAGAVTCWEARAAGRPMIVSNVDGLPEQVPPDIGLIVNPDDVAHLSDAIVKLASLDRAPMSIAARHSTSGAFPRTIDAWRSMLNRPKSNARQPASVALATA
jgi:D-inositol-3-phosphate glycosyltransferase